METNNNAKEVVFYKANLSKRLISYFYDISIWLLSSLILFTATNSILNNTKFVKDKENELIAIKNESHLYHDDIVISSYVDDENHFANTAEKNEYLTSSIDYFYKNYTFFSNNEEFQKYQERKINAAVDGIKLFVIKNGKLVENDVNPSYLLEFYKTEINDYCLGYLFNNDKYISLTSFNFIKVFLEGFIIITLFFIIYYLLLPLTIFKRGRQTIGMRLEKISLVNINGLNVSTGKYVGRFFFELGVMVYLSFVSFLIPCFVSITMVYVNKTNSSLVNYVFNDYCVSVENQRVYLNENERFISQEKLKEMSIENKNIKFK